MPEQFSAPEQRRMPSDWDEAVFAKFVGIWEEYFITPEQERAGDPQALKPHLLDVVCEYLHLDPQDTAPLNDAALTYVTERLAQDPGYILQSGHSQEVG